MHARPLVLLMGALLAALFVVTPTLAGTDFEGSVLSAGDEQLIVMTDEDQHSFVVNDDTKITLDGAEASLGDLMAGQTASVSAEMEGDQWIAKSIDAQSAK